MFYDEHFISDLKLNQSWYNGKNIEKKSYF